MRGLLLVGLLMFSGAAGTRAQQPADSRLATVRTAWIETDDELSDALPLAACFKSHLTGTTPLTLAPKKAEADVVLRFSGAAGISRLAAFLPDGTDNWPGTQLWAGAVVENPRYRGNDLECKLADELAVQLRTAMRLARGGM